MAPLRSLLVLLILIGLVSAATAVAQAPVQWYTDSGGGAVAGPSPDLHGGGAVAPITTGPGAGSPDQQTPSQATPPSATPFRPVAQAPAPPIAVAARAQAPDKPAAGAQAEPAGSSQRPIGSLPFTGLELVVIVTAGLCLLVAGAALRPRPARR